MFFTTRALALAALVSCATTGAAQAEFKTGNMIIADCESAAVEDRMVCLGYVEGVVGAMGMNAVNGYQACVPDHVTGNQVKDVAIAYIYAHPAKRHFAATGLVADALAGAFPCAKSDKPKLNS
jgi:Rap1a immunity proteins